MIWYSPHSGEFRWRYSPASHLKPWDLAGSKDKNGYIRVCLNGKRYLAQRLAFLYVNGKLPALNVDHVDRDRGNNRWQNLREVTRKQNAENRTLHKNNKSGFIGVSYDKKVKSGRLKLSTTASRFILAFTKRLHWQVRLLRRKGLNFLRITQLEGEST